MADQNITAKFETTVHFLKYELKFLFGKRVNSYAFSQLCQFNI
jgi:hypothetical protein